MLKISTDIIRGHIFVPFHYSKTLVNKLTDSAVDPLGQTPCFKLIPVILRLASLKPNLDQEAKEDESPEIREARLLSVSIYKSMIKQGYVPIAGGTYFGAKTHKMSFKLNEKDKIDITIKPIYMKIEHNFTTPKGKYQYILSVPDITIDQITINNLRRAIGRICAKIVISLENN
ncbi:MAG: molybdopterin dinucleotide binding domain-containing protein [Candidatus Hodarchaeota archaeon]